MRKIAIISIVLLIAGIGLAFGQAGSCTCPANGSCGPAVCQENCTGACAQGADGASQCAANCPQSGCSNGCTGQGSCPIGATPCCGR
ncbi:MAG: hypothetical protein PHQ34_07085 [Methanothrix sp.]|nr:hypothetical protein [Methanothrix sp.]